MSKTTLTTLVLYGGLLMARMAPAEDIDIFKAGGSQDNSPPNVLVFLDNTSNWSASSQAWNKVTVLSKCGGNTICQGYVEQIFGSNSSLTQGQVEVGALKLVLNELTCNAANPLNLNVGLMIIKPDKGTYKNNSGSQTDSSGISGVIRRAVLPLVLPGSSPPARDIARCSTLMGDLDTIFNNVTGTTFKAASNANYGGAMLEAFKYFGGHTSPAGAASGTAGSPTGHISYGSKRFGTPQTVENEDASYTFADPSTKLTYSSPIASQTQTCNAKNFVLLVGNTWPNADDKTLLTSTDSLHYGYTESAFPFASGSQPRLGDVWSQFLASTDVSSIAGQQTLLTYTLNVYNASADASQTTLLKSMAQKGGGSYYEVGGNLYDLVNAFRSFFISINAQNSTYSPPAVNLSTATRGIYLNQIYLGMFRPEAVPRWFGNLKLYQLGLDAADSVILIDAAGNPAADSGNGFVANTAKSFWTHDSTFWNYRCGTTVSVIDPMLCGTYPYPTRASDAPDGAVVEKGATGQMLREAFTADLSNSARKLYTSCATANCVLPAFTTSASGITLAALGAASDAERTQIINWTRGVDNNGENPISPNAARPSMPGDILHAQPVAVTYNSGATSCTDKTNLDKDIVVYYASNDGQLHAAQGGTSGVNAGGELWAFLPEEFYGILKRLRDNSPPVMYTAPVPPNTTNKPYTLDGNLSVYAPDANNDCKPDKVWIYLTMRRGGRFIYALDVSNKTSPKLLWLKQGHDSTKPGYDAAYAELGQTWSEAVPFLLADDTPALIFGAGYDAAVEDRPFLNASSGYGNPPSTTKTMGRGIFIADAQTGTVRKFFGPATQTGQTIPMLDSVPSQVAIVTNLLTGVARYAYAGDTGGNLWRISFMDVNGVPSSNPDDWKLTKIASLGNPSDTSKTGPHARKFLYPPNLIPIEGGYALMIGSGDREKPFETTVLNRFYRINDNVSANTLVSCEGTGETNCGLVNATDTYGSGANGWYINMPNTGEKVVGGAVTDAGVTFFPTNTPNSSENPCALALGVARMYSLQAGDGGPEIVNGVRGERSETINSGGFPATPKLVTVAITKADGTTTNVTAVLAPPGFVRKRPSITSRRSIVFRYREGLD